MASHLHSGAWILVVALWTAPAAAHSPHESSETPPAETEPDWSQNLTLEELLQIELAAPSKQRQRAREAPGVATLVTREQIHQFG
jgi:hypothetical protein